jgi:hypothetical protein
MALCANPYLPGGHSAPSVYSFFLFALLIEPFYDSILMRSSSYVMSMCTMGSQRTAMLRVKKSLCRAETHM